jgi:ubiquinone/menaquinone biosynthesis C-methylase UbiE
MNLLPPEALLKTGVVDHADWNFRPVLGSIQRVRFKLVASFLPRQRCQRLLEIGYGSGVFMPELSRSCVELYGIDVHQEHGRVQEVLSRYGYQSQLFSGDAARMPFAPAFFDCVVAVSAVEFIEDLDAACREVRRVLRPGGSFIVVTPGKSAVVDFGLKVLTGESARRDYGDRRSRVMDTLRKHFPTRQERTVPRVGSSLFRLYTGLKLDIPADVGNGDREELCR